MERVKMQIETIDTKRLYLRGFQKEDAVFAISIWNDPEMGEYLPDEAMVEIDETYLKEIEKLPEDEVCCYLIAELKICEKYYKKRGTELEFCDYVYELNL